MHPSMGAILLGLAMLSSGATISPIDSVSLSDDNIPTLNASGLGAIDRRFSMTHQYNGPALDETHCLMNIVFLLYEFSLLDFTSSIDPTVGIGAMYPDVLIVLSALAPRHTIETRFFIWGLYAGATLMIAQNVFQTVDFTLQWDGVAVGTITLRKPPRPSNLGGSSATDVLTQESQTTSTIPSTVDNSTNDSYTIDTTTAPDNPESQDLTVVFTSFRNPLPKYDVYMTVMRALTYIAEKDESDELRPFAINAPRPFNAILRLTQYRSPTQPGAELFSYGMASQSLPAIPQTLMEHGWREANFEAVFDGVPVGKGALVKGAR